MIKSVLLFWVCILYALFDQYGIRIYTNYTQRLALREIKRRFNERILAITEEEKSYYKHVKTMINNFDYFQDVDFGKIIDEKQDITMLLMRLNVIKPRKYHLRFSDGWNSGIFLPIVFPIIFNTAVILKKCIRADVSTN